MSKKPITHYAHWDEMIFEGREKAYGAFFLRQRYPRHVLLGLLGAALLGASLIAFPRWRHVFFSSPAEVAQQMRTVVLATTDISRPQAKPQAALPQLPPPEPPRLRTLELRIPEPSADIDPHEDQTMHTVDSLAKAPNLGLANLDGADRTARIFETIGEGEEDIPTVILEQEIPNIGDFRMADEEPVPLNMDEIQKVIDYPSIAREAGIQGTVVVRVLVGKDGRYLQHRVVNSVHPLLDREVEKHLGKLRFSPAIQGKRPILFWVNIPFSFRTIN